MFGMFQKSDQFFNLFEEAASSIKRGSELMLELCKNSERRVELVGAIREVEHKGDNTVRQLTKLLVKSFVTPLDREDIHLISSAMDDVLDHIDDAATLYLALEISDPIPEYLQLAELLVKATQYLVEATSHIRTVKARTRAQVLIHKVHDLESQGDSIHSKAIARLFREEHDPINILKWKLLCDDLEEALDACQKVGNLFGIVILKTA